MPLKLDSESTFYHNPYPNPFFVSEKTMMDLSTILRETPNTSLTSSMNEFNTFLHSIVEKVKRVEERMGNCDKREKSVKELDKLKGELNNKVTQLDYLNEAMLAKSSVRMYGRMNE